MNKLTDISHPTVKIVQVMEFLGKQRGGTSLTEIAENSGIAKATLLRILNTLIMTGYVRKNREKNYYTCFRLDKMSSIPLEYDPLIEKTVDELVQATGQSAEIITVGGNFIYWYYKKEPPNLPVRINAKTGFTRSIYELDAPSRVYLNLIGPERAGKKYDTKCFYDVSYQKCDWKTAVEIFTAETGNIVAYDVQGNSNGIRRYATVITKPNGKFEFILAIAEPALPRTSTEAHYKQIIEVLLKTRQGLNEKLENIREII